MIRSLFFDIDGTLVSFKTHEIPASAISALTQAKVNGMKVYISTGRPVPLITNLKAIDHIIDGYITVNGALCFVKEETICCNSIHHHDVQLILDDARRMDYPCIVVGEKDIAIFNPKDIVDKVFRGEINVTNLDYATSVDLVLKQRILQISPFFDAEYEKGLMAKIPDCISGRWHQKFTDITACEADKGKGLLAMSEHMGFEISETMAFGDGGNDVSIIRQAGIGVAMGNGNESAKEAADYITTSVDDDGVRNALRHFGII